MKKIIFFLLMMNKPNINFPKCFSFPFQKIDWKKRSLEYGAISLPLTIAIICSLLFLFIPKIGFIVFGIFALLIILVLNIVEIFWLGFQFEVSKTIIEKKDYKSIKILQNFSQRIRRGFTLFIAYFFYNLPMLIISIVFFTLLIILIFNDHSYDSDFAMIIFTIGILIYTLIFFAYAIVFQFIKPAIFSIYFKNRNINSVLDISRVFSFIKENFSNLIVAIGIEYLFGFIGGLIMQIAYYSIFICVGLIIFPVITAIYGTIYTFLQSYLNAAIFLASEGKEVDEEKTFKP